MLISVGILPVYSLLKTGQQRIVRADIRVMATLYGVSALELARTLGYDRAQKLNNELEFIELKESAAANGFEIKFEPTLQPIVPLPPGAKPMFLLRVRITVESVRRAAGDSEIIPSMDFVTILSDPRHNFY